MRKITVPLAFAATVSLTAAAVMFMVSGAVSLHAQAPSVSSYAEDRAAIEDLQARYLFALDFHDPDLYVSTFTPDGVLDYGSGVVKGRQAIKDVIAKMPNRAATAGLRPAAARHISRISLSKWTATKQPGARIGTTSPTTTPSAGASSTGSGTMRTNW